MFPSHFNVLKRIKLETVCAVYLFPVLYNAFKEIGFVYEFLKNPVCFAPTLIETVFGFVSKSLVLIVEKDTLSSALNMSRG